jgi:putative ABC transport system permease protein
MWFFTIRDLQWRRRRFIIAIVAAGLAFALSLIMSGTLHNLRQEGVRTVNLYEADAWVVADGVTGPFTSASYIDGDSVDTVRQLPGVHDASPLLIGRSVNEQDDINVVGYERGSFTQPLRVTSGAAPTERGVATVDEMLGLKVGDTVTFSGKSFPVGAVVTKTSFYFGMPTVFLPIEDVRDALAAGEPVVTTVVVRGPLAASSVPSGLSFMTNDDVREDLDRVLIDTAQTLGIINTLLWIMAAGIIAALVYITVLERTRELAVHKATGSSNGSLVRGLLLQASVLALFAAVIAAGIALVLAPTFPFAVEIPIAAYIQLISVALIVGGIASLAGLRRIVRIDPALAFGGA